MFSARSMLLLGGSAQLNLENCIVSRFYGRAVEIHQNPFEGLKRENAL
ncbi:hypothetical protein CKA32_001388 [Geitlerinema sp. FC II]|nr:hypothetical protein CKA32_001388 [Geitlerinema sp. FC II]